MMTETFRTVSLEQVVSYRKEFIEINDEESYKRCRVQLHAQGVVLRDQVPGIEIKTKKQQVCRDGDFLVAEIDAKVGGFGIVPPNLDGAIVSSHYFLFSLNEKLLDRNFLDYFIRTPQFREQVSAQGSTNYAAIRPNHVLGYKIPFLSLPEQRRIVARIEELAAKIEEARGLRRQALKETELLSSIVSADFLSTPKWPYQTIEELVGRANLKNGKSIKATEQPTKIRCLTLSSMRNGQIDCAESKPIGMTISEAKPYLVKKGDVFIVRGNGSKDLVGRAGIVTTESQGIIFPDLFIRVPLNPDQILGEFFVSLWNSKRMREIIVDRAKTTSGIWKINQGHIASFSIPLPLLDEQRRIVTYLQSLRSKMDLLTQLQTETAVELDALMPAILDRAFRGEL